MSAPTEPVDPALLRRALLDLRVAYDDGDAITTDMLRPRRERELGPAQHARIYQESRDKVRQTVSWLLRALGDAG
jgi:hypothetical protein